VISIKPGAKLAGLQPEMVLALVVADQVYGGFDASLVVTEGTGGQHMVGSLHSSGFAVDLRTSNVRDTALQGLGEELKRRLGENYDVVVEHDHAHVEFDPK
jgi:hypothetical protein